MYLGYSLPALAVTTGVKNPLNAILKFKGENTNERNSMPYKKQSVNST